MTVTLLLFASYREQVGQKKLVLELPHDCRVKDLAEKLEADYPELSLTGGLCAVNEHYAEPDKALSNGDTVAFFPPVSGGSGALTTESLDHFIVTDAPLDLGDYHQRVAAPEYGAIASFLGTVRSPNLGQPVRYIDYQGYEAMIITQMRVIANELREAFELGKLLLAHRLARLEPGEASIAVVISAKHRRDALQACQQGIDRAKELLPVWKYEVGDRDAHWVPGAAKAGPLL